MHPKTSNPWNLSVYDQSYSDELGCVDKDGNIFINENPGLGVSYDWKHVFKNTISKIEIK